MPNGKESVRNEIADLAERLRSDPARYSQASASVLFSLAGALSADQEELLMQHTAKFSQAMVTRIQAEMN